MTIVPLNRSHLHGAVRLHLAVEAWCYRGRRSRGVLRAFYDACANRDFTVGTAALEEGKKVVGVLCGATDLEGAAAWLGRRRRSLGARLAGGTDLARGGWEAEALRAEALRTEPDSRPVYLLAAAIGGGLTEEDVRALFDYFAAAASSRGATHICAPAVEPENRLLKLGFDLRGDGSAAGKVPYLYVRAI